MIETFEDLIFLKTVYNNDTSESVNLDISNDAPLLLSSLKLKKIKPDLLWDI